MRFLKKFIWRIAHMKPNFQINGNFHEKDEHLEQLTLFFELFIKLFFRGGVQIFLFSYSYFLLFISSLNKKFTYYFTQNCDFLGPCYKF